MGYSMLTHLDGHEIRYTEWVHYPGPSKNFKPDWSTNYGTDFTTITPRALSVESFFDG